MLVTAIETKSRGGISLPDAAQRIGKSWHVAWAELLKGELRGEKGPGGRWMIEPASVEEYNRRHGPAAA